MNEKVCVDNCPFFIKRELDFTLNAPDSALVDILDRYMEISGPR